MNTAESGRVVDSDSQTGSASAAVEPALRPAGALWGVDVDAVLTLSALRFEVPTWAFHVSGRHPTSAPVPDVRELVADAGVVHRLTGAVPEVGLYPGPDRIENPAGTGGIAGISGQAAACGVRIGSVHPDVTARPGRPLPLAHQEPGIRARALRQLRRSGALASAVGARRLVVRLHDDSPYPGAAESSARTDRLRDALATVAGELDPAVTLLIGYSIDRQSPVRRRAGWQVAEDLCEDLGPGVRVLFDVSADGADSTASRNIAALRSAHRLGGLAVGGHTARNPFDLFVAFLDLTDGGTFVRGRRSPVPLLLDPGPGATGGITSVLASLVAMQTAAAKTLLLERGTGSDAPADDPAPTTEAMVAAYEGDAGPLLAAAREACGLPADPVAEYSALCRDTHRLVERQAAASRAAWRRSLRTRPRLANLPTGPVHPHGSIGAQPGSVRSIARGG